VALLGGDVRGTDKGRQLDAARGLEALPPLRVLLRRPAPGLLAPPRLLGSDPLPRLVAHGRLPHSTTTSFAPLSTEVFSTAAISFTTPSFGEASSFSIFIA